MPVEMWVEMVVAALLLVTAVYCFILDRRLRALRGAQGEMRKLIEEFTIAMREAEDGLSELRGSGEALSRDLAAEVERGRSLYDELKIMTQSGNELADRIERGLVGRGAPAKAAPVDDDARSESERELIEALRQAR